MTSAPRTEPMPPTSGAAVHPPKVELFDLAAMTNTDPKGIVRPVDEYRVEPFGLYVARPLANHPTTRYLESWLLPSLNLRVTDWHYHPGHERDQDFYLDIAIVEPGPVIWRTIDHYLDIVVRTGRDLELLDLDELLAAMRTALLDQTEGQRALETAYHAVEKIAAAGYDLGRWLTQLGIHLTWNRR